MKTASLLFLGLFMLTVVSSCTKDKVGKIDLPAGYYENDWEAALSAASDHDRPVFIQFYAEWCTSCANFKENVLNDPEVSTYMNEHFVGVLMDAEKDKGKDRFDHYGLSGYPNLTIVDKDGNLIANNPGDMTKADFLAWLRKYE